MTDNSERERALRFQQGQIQRVVTTAGVLAGFSVAGFLELSSHLGEGIGHFVTFIAFVAAAASYFVTTFTGFFFSQMTSGQMEGLREDVEDVHLASSISVFMKSFVLGSLFTLLALGSVGFIYSDWLGLVTASIALFAAVALSHVGARILR